MEEVMGAGWTAEAARVHSVRAPKPKCLVCNGTGQGRITENFGRRASDQGPVPGHQACYYCLGAGEYAVPMVEEQYQRVIRQLHEHLVGIEHIPARIFLVEIAPGYFRIFNGRNNTYLPPIVEDLAQDYGEMTEWWEEFTGEEAEVLVRIKEGTDLMKTPEKIGSFKA